jgi:BAAT / Acyl-CoA thioester hydrolase C terminal
VFDSLRVGALIGLATLVACASLAADPAAPLPPEAGAVSISPPPARFVLRDGGVLHYLELGPSHWGLSEPPQHRVYVIPGSGCNGLAGIALDYFQGLGHGEVVVPHKRQVDVLRWQPDPTPCSAAFLRDDNLEQWALDATTFIRWHLQHHPLRENQPMALVGISEGAELLAVLAAEVPQVKLLVLLGSSGLDPLEALSLQAEKKGARKFVSELQRNSANPDVPNERIWAGRSMAYWRSLVNWRYSDALLTTHHPLLLGFGGQDEAVPLTALRQFELRARVQNRPLCVAVFDEADHSLRVNGIDRPLQHYWALVSDALQRDKPLRACPRWAAH